MEEPEEFDPTDPERPPQSLLEVDQCISIARSQLEAYWRYSFSQEELCENHLHQKPSANSLEVPNSLSSGVLFYPCAESDTNLVIDVFANLVASIYFCDVRHPVKKVRGNFVDSKSVPFIGRVFTETGSEIFRLRQSSTSSQGEINYCVGDSVHFFLQSMKRISVFFYRRDSPNPDGEGGSGVLWFGPVLLDLLLQRIVNGGILCTDFSNSSGFLAERLQKLVVGEKLQYRNLTLIRLEPSKLAARLVPLTIVQVLRT